MCVTCRAEKLVEMAEEEEAYAMNEEFDALTYENVQNLIHARLSLHKANVR